MSYNAEAIAQAEDQAANQAAQAAIAPLNPEWPYVALPIDLWVFGLNADIAAKYLRPASLGG